MAPFTAGIKSELCNTAWRSCMMPLLPYGHSAAATLDFFFLFINIQPLHLPQGLCTCNSCYRFPGQFPCLLLWLPPSHLSDLGSNFPSTIPSKDAAPTSSWSLHSNEPTLQLSYLSVYYLQPLTWTQF